MPRTKPSLVLFHRSSITFGQQQSVTVVLQSGGHGEHKSKGCARPLNDTDKAGWRGRDAAHLCDSGLCVEQQTAHSSLEYSTAEPLGAACWEETGSVADVGGMPMKVPPSPSPFSPLKLHPHCLGSDGNINSSRRLFSATKPHVPTINQHLQLH